MKRTIILLLCAIFICTALAGCSSGGKSNDPKDVISGAYGNSEFKISFSAAGLTAPLKDMTYTAGKMPTLPTPERIGYVFAGWYLDAEYTIPYVDGILYLYMTDVTLYAKWEKESLVQNGIYDVEYRAVILEDTVKKGELTDQYGGYKDFTQSLVVNEICLEKTGDSLLLKLQYDTGRTIPMTSGLAVYSVKVSPKSGSEVYIEKRIDSHADPVKTIFINLDHFNLEDTLYLDIQASNWEAEDLSDADRQKTTTKYTVAFNFTRIIGFSKPYIDPDVPLEAGYYLAKSYYKKMSNEESVADAYNPVYSYIYSDGENYTLIKQNIPYGGLASLNALDPWEMAKNYYHRAMSLIPTMLFYEIASPPEGDEPVQSDWYPSAYDALYYGNYATEYHADTGKFYNIFDLGKSVKKSFVAMNAVTGFMEVASGMSYNNLILTIDYEHIIKLASADYEPLTGDAYQYQSKMQYYPGDVKDLQEKGLDYSIMTESGLCTDMISFFFSAPSLDLPASARKQYSSRMTVTPTVGTNAKTVADSRYSIADFHVNTQVFGYDVRSSDPLYADSMGVQKTGTIGLRRNITVTTGKSYTVGETVRLEELYAEKCNLTGDFSQVSWKVYHMNHGTVDYNSPVQLSNSAFSFAEDVAVLFESKTETGTNRTVVELATYAEPKVNIINSVEYPYDPDGYHEVGETLSYPYLTYSWMGVTDVLIDDFYDSASNLSGEIEKGADPLRVAVFEKSGNGYELACFAGYNTSTFIIPAEEFIVVYELTNKYGELYHYTIPFSCESQTRYRFKDNNGTICFEGPVRYHSNTGERMAIRNEFLTELLSEDTYKEQLTRSYLFELNSWQGNMPLVSYDICTNNGTYSDLIPDADLNVFAETVWNLIKDCEYAAIKMNYNRSTEDATLIATFLYGMTFNGNASPYELQFRDYFTDYEYIFLVPKLYSSTGKLISVGQANISSSGRSRSIKKDGSQYRFTVYEAGEYTVSQEFFLGSISITFEQNIRVWSNTTDVRITYVTDAAHPFSDGTLEKTVTYSLAEAIYTLKKNSFSPSIRSSEVLYGWTTAEGASASTAYRSGSVLSDFVTDFNAKDVTLYAYWDPGLKVTANAGDGVVYTEIYYLNHFGWYSIALYTFNVTPPDGYSFVGWSGRMFGDRIVNSRTGDIHGADVSDPDFGVIHAVFKKQYTVKFSVDPAYSNAFFRNEIVLDGDGLKAISSKQDLSCKADGYRFAGWYIQGDDTQTLIDLETYVVTENVTLVAKFVPVEE